MNLLRDSPYEVGLIVMSWGELARWWLSQSAKRPCLCEAVAILEGAPTTLMARRRDDAGAPHQLRPDVQHAVQLGHRSPARLRAPLPGHAMRIVSSRAAPTMRRGTAASSAPAAEAASADGAVCRGR